MCLFLELSFLVDTSSVFLKNSKSMIQVLAELKEYATEVDVDFVRKAVRAIGRCAIKVEPSAEKCVTTLLELIQTKVNYVVQEAIVVIKVSSLLCRFFNNP